MTIQIQEIFQAIALYTWLQHTLLSDKVINYCEEPLIRPPKELVESGLNSEH